MGIINTSPNSFYNACNNVDDALKLAEKMVREDADILDIGGEATNPMITIESSTQMEMDRVIPVIEAIKKNFDISISVDTSRPEVMKAAVNAGANMINDQRALKMPNALSTAIQLKVPVCLMHGFHPARIAGSSTKEKLLSDIKNDFLRWIKEYQAAGLSSDHIILDPGFGGGHYGKNTEENYYLLKHLDELTSLGYPSLIGWSRKSMLGETLNGAPPKDRLYASLAAAILAAQKGATIIRTHDVGATQDALKVWERFENA